MGWSPCWLVQGNPALTKPVVLAWLLRAPSFTLMPCPPWDEVCGAGKPREVSGGEGHTLSLWLQQGVWIGGPPPGLEWEDQLHHCVIPREGEGSCGPRDVHGLGVWEGGLGSSIGAHAQPSTMLSSPLTLEAEATCKG